MDGFLRIKLQIPLLQQQRLASRTRIDSRLNEGLDTRLTLVTAPAGYGKTTAVAKWAQQLPIPVAWFSTDNMDNSFKRFWSYCIAALDSIIPGLEDRFSRYLSSSENITVSGIVTPLIDEIYQYSKSFVLVLDDYHLIEESSIHESMAFLLKYLPDNAHLVVISRTHPPFSSVRLQTIGHTKEIGLSDLQFTTDEIAVLCETKGIPVVMKDLVELEALTEGWAAGLYLLLDFAEKGKVGPSRRISDTNRHQIAAYLSEEVIKQWGEAEKSFLMKTSVLHALTGPLCDALTGRNDGKEILQRLAGRNAFVITLDSESGWYRYHHLLAEFLQKRLDESIDAEKNTLHERAGAWYENEGYFTEAVGHYLKGHRYERVADIIENKGREMLKTGAAEILIAWLGSLPHTLVASRDLLCLTYAWALILIDREQEARHWLNQVEVRLDDPTAKYRDEGWRRQLESELVAARGFIELRMQNLKNVTQSMVRFQEIMKQGSIFLSFGVNFNMGGASVISSIFGLKGRLKIVEKEYFSVYEKTRSFIKVHNGYIPTLMGEILFERNKMDEAVAMLVKGGMEAEESGAIGCQVPLAIIYARVLKSRGDIQGAFAVVRDGEEKLRKTGGIHLLPIISAFETRMHIDAGNHKEVDGWMARCCLDVFDNPGLLNIFEFFTFARVLIEKKAYENCLLILNKIKLFAEKEENLLYVLEAQILLAVVFYLQGYTKKAMEYLRQALVIGEANGYERIFIEEGVPMVALLGRFVKSDIMKPSVEREAISPVYVRKLLKLTRDYCALLKVFKAEKANTAESSTYKKMSLTKREKDILHFLDSGFTNAEIAYTLDISINTVKVNCFNIYRKLEVKNRDQAVRIAKKLELY